jgi:cytochrome bd-type quinol oxidase subunit 2
MLTLATFRGQMILGDDSYVWCVFVFTFAAWPLAAQTRVSTGWLPLLPLLVRLRGRR